MNPRRWIIRFITPLVWRLFPSRRLAALQEFSRIEKDSGGQLLDCLRQTRDPKLKSYLFQHVLEEFFHGELFHEAARRLSAGHLPETFPPREHMDGREENLRGFFAEVHVGEEAVNRDFLVYADSRLDSRLKNVFRRAGMDEGHHEHDTNDILLALCGNDRAEYRRVLGRARRKRWWKLYASSLKAFGELQLSLLLSILYYASGAFVVHSARSRLRLPREKQVELFREQIRDFEAETR